MRAIINRLRDVLRAVARFARLYASYMARWVIVPTMQRLYGDTFVTLLLLVLIIVASLIVVGMAIGGVPR